MLLYEHLLGKKIKTSRHHPGYCPGLIYLVVQWFLVFVTKHQPTHSVPPDLRVIVDSIGHKSGGTERTVGQFGGSCGKKILNFKH